MTRLLAALLAASLVLIAAQPAPAGSIAPGDPWQPWQDGWVAFETTDNVKEPTHIWVVCEQDGTVVFSQANGSADWVELGGDWASWTGPADCTATLYTYLKVRGQQTYVPLDVLAFSIA